MKDKREIEGDAVDLLLVGAILVLALVSLVLLVPLVWQWGGVVLEIRRWPFWVWTCLGVTLLCVLLWLRSRYEGG